MAWVSDEYIYDCFFCERTIYVKHEKDRMYKTPYEKQGQHYICMCPECVHNLKSILFKMRKSELTEEGIWHLLESPDLAKVQEGIKYLKDLPVKKDSLIRIHLIMEKCGSEYIKSQLNEYLKIYKPYVTIKEYKNE